MAYTYIERAYGKHFEAGQRVRFTEYEGARGNGVVRGVRNDPQYVRILFDDGHEGDCHPDSVEIVQRQYLACEFTEGGRRYTYHNDGEPVSVGDKVIVETKNGEASIAVVEILDKAPPFETKAIKGPAPVEDESEGDAAA